MRKITAQRRTGETDIALTIDLDGRGAYQVDTGCGFLDHMLALFARHGRCDLTLTCQGDTQVDDHHTVEDVAIVLGGAMSQALGDRAGICRYGSCILPMDEALVLAAVDISGRPAVGYGMQIPSQKVGTFDTELVEEFLQALARSWGAAIHVRQFAGQNSHHIIEAMFKALARALAEAVRIDEKYAGEIPSTKGTIL